MAEYLLNFIENIWNQVPPYLMAQHCLFWNRSNASVLLASSSKWCNQIFPRMPNNLSINDCWPTLIRNWWIGFLLFESCASFPQGEKASNVKFSAPVSCYIKPWSSSVHENNISCRPITVWSVNIGSSQ